MLARAGRAAEQSRPAAEAVRVVAIGKTKPVSLLRQLRRELRPGVYHQGAAGEATSPGLDWTRLGWVAGSPSVCWLIDSALFSCLLQLPEDIRWHFVGHLQSNKVKSLVGTQEGAKEMLDQGMEALRAEEHIAADAGGRAGEPRIGGSADWCFDEEIGWHCLVFLCILVCL
ncbi:hypothetical protein CFC21_023140 [Triticum aestivum]|uniref:Uncharacterized protein n=2 Tax=Triticum aestivum TaxID=4565 RepID=A0A9R1J8L8_WHEAT|nr:hypothetical protein CFC21_023140 [Triticum aestivum]